MRIFKQGDVVRVPFPDTDGAARQYRPALAVSPGAIGVGGHLLWVVMITSAANRAWPDVDFGAGYSNAGLPAPSRIRPAKIATIDADRAEPLGKSDADIVSRVLDSLRAYMAPAVV
jgi:mRNA interferase MazF